MRRFNEFIAVTGTKAFGSVVTFYLFVAIGVTPLIPACAAYRETVLLVSSCLIQLAALPLISCGQQVLNRSTEARAAQDHQQILELHADLHERQKEAREMRLQAAKQRDEADAKRHEMDAKLDVLLDKVDELLDRR